VIAGLPFTLTPLDGEPFEMWLHAYAARLALSPSHLAAALGIPRGDGQVTTWASPAQVAAICAATGLAPAVVTGMFTTGPAPSPLLLRAWMPQRWTRFCPACLLAGPGPVPAAWRLPLTFFCLRHGLLLARSCPHCGRAPASLTSPAQAGHCGGPDGCGGPLAAALPPGCTSLPAARQAQEAINGFRAGLRDPGATAAARRHALGQLTDITLIAFHLATASTPPPQRSFTPGLLDAGTITQAFTLLTPAPEEHGPDLLATLDGTVKPGTTPSAVPESWRSASPALRTRIARARDPWLAPPSRLRHATTLATPHPPAPRLPGQPDLAVIRAARLPDQIWADWAIRLTDATSARRDWFRSSALAALLLPHSSMPLRQITELVSSQLKRHIAAYHMAKLAADPAALRVLTELAFAIDAHHIPINYQRRRDLTATTTLIDPTTWTTIAHDAGIRAGRLHHARRYLYELLTGGSLRTAPPPYQLTSAAQASYHDFTLGLPASLVTTFHQHARHLLHTHHINDEPLQWQPPARWVTATTWPGTDPAGTDPAPIHQALLHDHTPPAQIAADLGISLDHLHQVIRYHPLPRPLRPTRHTLIPTTAPASLPPGQQPGVLYLDPAWLSEEYLTWHRSLNDIAHQLGCPVKTLSTFAHQHGIPIRPRGSSQHITSTAAPGQHPRDLPEPLRHALTGRNAQQRLQRLLITATHPSIHQAATASSLRPSILYTQITSLEHLCGGPLIQRCPRPPSAATLTPLGEQLRTQARDYLGLSIHPGQQAVITTRRNRQLPRT
jgi:TniQ